MDAVTKKNYFNILFKYWTKSYAVCLQNVPNYREMRKRCQKEGFI